MAQICAGEQTELDGLRKVRSGLNWMVCTNCQRFGKCLKLGLGVLESTFIFNCEQWIPQA